MEGPGAAVAILVVALAIGGGTAGAWIRRPPAPPTSPARLPWDLADAARRQITILSGQAAVAVTALVLLVTLVRQSTGAGSATTIAGQSFNTTVAMVLIAFLSFVGAAVQFVNLPIEGGAEGTDLPRWLYLLASNQHFRTLFLAWLALKPLVETFGLHEPATILSWVLGSVAMAAWLIIASVAYRLGILARREAFGVPAAGLAVALAAGVVLRLGPVVGHEADAVLALTLGLFGLNVVAFLCSALVPLALEGRAVPQSFGTAGRLWALLDLQASVVILALIWLMVL